MSMLLVSTEEADTLMNERFISESTIGTKHRGYCIALISTFKFNGEHITVFTHYSHSIKKGKKNNHRLVGNLIQLIEHISMETRRIIG